MPKLAIFGQAVSYMGSESNYCLKWQIIESNYCQNWQYLDKISSNMDAKSCQKWQKTLYKSCQFWQLNIAPPPQLYLSTGSVFTSHPAFRPLCLLLLQVTVYIYCIHCRWGKLQKDSEAHKARLLRALEQFKKVKTCCHVSCNLLICDRLLLNTVGSSPRDFRVHQLNI